MIAQISELAARILIEEWFNQEPGMQRADAQIYFPPTVGDWFDLDGAYLIYQEDGWYVATREVGERLEMGEP